MVYYDWTKGAGLGNDWIADISMRMEYVSYIEMEGFVLFFVKIFIFFIMILYDFVILSVHPVCSSERFQRNAGETVSACLRCAWRGLMRYKYFVGFVGSSYF